MSLDELLQELALQYGYVGVFLASFLGASSVAFPIPYTIMLPFLGAYTHLDLGLLALFSGLGSALGEIVGYALGKAGRLMVNEERRENLTSLLKLLEARRYLAPLLIFLFALTPLPDDLLFIPLGLVGYSLLAALAPCFLGKALMAYALCYAGRFYNQLLISLFGKETTGLTTLLVASASAALLMVIIVILMKVDWKSAFERLA